MEHLDKQENNKINKKEDVSKRVINLLNESLKNPWENFGDRINYILDKLISGISKKDIKDKDVQRELFDKVYNFLNNFFKEIEIKKFYNNIPRISLDKYANMNMGNQMVNNIYGKEWKIFYREQVNWWDCYYWTVLLKNVFDKLKAEWLSIEDRIFMYDEPWGHSSILIKFQGKIYLADYGLFNQMFGGCIAPIEQFDGHYQKWAFTKVSFNKKGDDGVLYFDKQKDFIKHVSQKKINVAAVEFNPKLMDGKEHHVRIVFFKKYIAFTINEKEYKYYFEDSFCLPKTCKNTDEVLGCLLKWVQAEKQEKNELKLYFDMIKSKINSAKIYEIFQ